mgnify:CR=1 FL=1
MLIFNQLTLTNDNILWYGTANKLGLKHPAFGFLLVLICLYCFYNYFLKK